MASSNARQSALDTVVLALELLKRIPRGRKITASELHQQLQSQGFERDLRSIQRQLEALSTRFEIERDDRSKPYGYSWKARAPGAVAAGAKHTQESVGSDRRRVNRANRQTINTHRRYSGIDP